MKRSILGSVTMAVLVTVLIMLIYVCVQQAYRSSANDPQLQIARDISYSLNHHKPINSFINSNSKDIAASLGSFVVLYNNEGNPVLSDGMLNKTMPQLPQGVLNFTALHDEDIITWQPQAGVRMAMAVKKVNTAQIGFVAAGRSLKEVEARISNLINMLLIGWAVSMAIILFHFLADSFLKRKTSGKL